MTENTYVVLKVTQASHPDKTPMEGMDGMKTMAAYKRNAEENGLGYTWYSTDVRIAQENVAKINELANRWETVPVLFVYKGKIIYSARILRIISGEDKRECLNKLNDSGKLEPGSIPKEFEKEREYPCRRTWLQITDIWEENELNPEMFDLESNGKNLGEVIRSQSALMFVTLASGK